MAPLAGGTIVRALKVILLGAIGAIGFSAAEIETIQTLIVAVAQTPLMLTPASLEPAADDPRIAARD